MMSISEWNEVVKKRISTCESCEFFRSTSRRCGQCGCFIDGKARLPIKYFNCPLKKWDNF